MSVTCRSLRLTKSMMLLNFFVFYALSTAAAEDDHGPINTVVVAGEPMSMVCGYNSIGSSIQWTYKNPDALGESSVFDGSRTFSGFTVNNVTNGFSREVTLIKNDTQMKDAGIYKCCVIQQTRTIIRTAQLIVLATDPKCDTNASDEDSGVPEGTFLNMWCNISFSGDFAPFMKWSRNDVIEFEGTLRNRCAQVSYAITKELKAEDNGKTYSCTTYFLPLNSTVALQPGVTRANNAPNYKYKWNFTAVVWFGPVNISVNPVKSIYNLHDNLQCLANGNPSPTYKWMTAEHVDIANGSNLTIDRTTARNIQGVIYCVATTNHKLSANISITIDLSNFAETPATQLAIMIVGSICIILLIIVIGMAVIRMKEAIRPEFQGELINEPDIVQYAENEGDYARPEELFLGNLCEHPEEQDIEHDLGAAGRPLNDPALAGMPIYSEINKGEAVAGAEEKAFDRYRQPVFPVYAAVRKTRIDIHVEPNLDEPYVSNENPVYAEVNKSHRGLIRDTEAIDMSSEKEETRQISVGQSDSADYLDMSGFRMCSNSPKYPSKPRSSMFSVSEYASIDHTLMPPPPPKLD